MKKRIFGYFAFFLLVAGVVTVAVLIFDAVSASGNVAKIAIIMAAVVFGLSLVCTVIDSLRRKYFEEEPLERILEATKRISNGDFNVDLVPRHSEKNYNAFDVIMENINDMAAQLAKAESQSKDFVTNVSHELKTPLAVLQTSAAMLLSGKADEKETARLIEVIDLTVKRMTALVGEILDLSRLESAQLLPPRESVDIEDLVSSCAISFEELLDAKNLRLEADLEPGLKLLSVRSYLKLIFDNLISNAVKFSYDGGKIELESRRIDGGAMISVRDHGVGIDKQTGERIFEKFYQGDASRKQEGSGIGLAIVKKAIDRLGGTISVQSVPKEGSCFTVVLHDLAQNES